MVELFWAQGVAAFRSVVSIGDPSDPWLKSMARTSPIALAASGPLCLQGPSNNDEVKPKPAPNLQACTLQWIADRPINLPSGTMKKRPLATLVSRAEDPASISSRKIPGLGPERSRPLGFAPFLWISVALPSQ